MSSTLSNITGRYAPSPTGALHHGNLRTALLAWLHARVQGGKFLVRMEDIDTPRLVDGSASQILRDLEWLGLTWDGEVVYQSQRLERYQEVLNQLSALGLTYPCYCSRKDIQQAASAPHGKSGVYPGTCANLDAASRSRLSLKKSPATRLRTSQTLVDDCGDFVIHRADGLFAYQLAVVVDDVDQQVTDVVRGRDLASSTERQRYLAQLIAADASPIRYWHAPLMLDEQGQRMSKRDGSESVLQWQSEGRSATQFIGHLAYSLRLIDCDEPLSATELLARLSLDMINSVLDED